MRLLAGISAVSISTRPAAAASCSRASRSRTPHSGSRWRRLESNTAISNAVFDSSLRQRDPEWGVRDLEALEQLAAAAGLVLIETAEMPANNLMLVFERRQAG